jgi:hypothetical protein
MNDAQRKIDRIESLARETGDWRLAFNQLRALLAQSTPPREPDSARLEVWQVRALDAATTMLSIIVNEHPGIFDATHVFTTTAILNAMARRVAPANPQSDQLLHRLRNPYGLTADEMRADRLAAADEIERYRNAAAPDSAAPRLAERCGRCGGSLNGLEMDTGLCECQGDD